VKVGELFQIIKGRKVDEVLPHKIENPVRYIQIEDLRNDDQLKFTKFSDDYVFCNEDDFVIAWDGANAGTVGFNLRGVIGSTLAILRKRKDIEYNTTYVGWFLRSKSHYLRTHCIGATVPHIQKRVLENIEIPLPDLCFQNKIAENILILNFESPLFR